MMRVVAVINTFLTLTTIITLLGTDTCILRLIPEHQSKYSLASTFRIYLKTQYFVAGVSILTGGFLFVSSASIADKIFSKFHPSFYCPKRPSKKANHGPPLCVVTADLLWT